MVRKKYSEYVERIPTDLEHIAVLKMYKELHQGLLCSCVLKYLCVILVTGKTPSTDLEYNNWSSAF